MQIFVTGSGVTRLSSVPSPRTWIGDFPRKWEGTEGVRHMVTYTHTFDAHGAPVHASVIHTYIPTYIHTYIHTSLLYPYAHISTYVHTYIHTYIHTKMHAYIQTYIHRYI